MTDLSGRTYVVTGANTGVGRATALSLAGRGAHVVLACRSVKRAEPVLRSVEPLAGTASLVVLDLGSLASVRRGAARITQLAPRIDGLINNAGVAGARGVTEDGFELAFGVNHLGHYLLTRLLLVALAPSARVVHVSSGSHRRVAALDLSRVRERTRGLVGLEEYAASKLCQVLFHHELTRRLAGANASVTSLAADPGDVASDAWRHVPWPVRPLLTCRMKSPADGALTSLFCATSAELDGRSGGFYVDRREQPPSELAQDRALAAELWARSARWVGLPVEIEPLSFAPSSKVGG